MKKKLSKIVSPKKVGEVLRRGAIGEVCTEPNLKVLLRCFLSKDKDVLNQVSKLFDWLFSKQNIS